MALFITTAVRTSHPSTTDYKGNNERKSFRRLCGRWALRNGTVGMILMKKEVELKLYEESCSRIQITFYMCRSEAQASLLTFPFGNAKALARQQN
jgi:hypothetical protein